MANNRLWIFDSATGDRILLAKSMGNGWYLWPESEKLDEWLQNHDRAASGGFPTSPSTLRVVDENHEPEPEELK